FFFQAEDGIRDRNVTGVQTCALRSPSRRRRKVRLIPPRADPPGSGFSNTNFSLLPCPENPENTANGSGKILESDSAQLRRFEREIGRASCRERGESWVVGVSLRKTS